MASLTGLAAKRLGVAVTAGMFVLGVLAARADAAGIAGFVSYSAPASAATTFVVPALNCSAVETEGFQAVALGVELGRPAGSSAVGIVAGCGGPTSPFYDAALQINGTAEATTLNISPGDPITASGSETSAGTTLSLADSADDGGAPHVVTGPGGTVERAAIGDTSVNCLHYFFSACSPVPELTPPTTFTNSTIDGTDLRSAHALRSNLYSTSLQLQISTSLLGSNHESFTTTWKSSCGFTSARC